MINTLAPAGVFYPSYVLCLFSLHSAASGSYARRGPAVAMPGGGQPMLWPAVASRWWESGWDSGWENGWYFRYGVDIWIGIV